MDIITHIMHLIANEGILDGCLFIPSPAGLKQRVLAQSV